MKQLILLAALIPAVALAAPDPAKLRDAALNDTIAYDIVEGLTTEVGQRLAGTEAEARGRAWAVRKLKALGFANVRVETFDMPVWERGVETAEIVAPFAQKLSLTALGNSGATPANGLAGEVVAFDSVAQLQAATPAQVRGKIVFLSHAMTATQDGSSYGAFGAARRQGPSIAASLGASAIVIRSIGSDRSRAPHTGNQNWASGVQPIPAAALSIVDAEQLTRILARGHPVTMKLVLTPRFVGTRQSGNVIAEVPGRDPAAGIVLIGGHLDSWDLGTGALDDAAGLGITTAAAKRLLDTRERPRRTVRLVWFGAEEVGLFGGFDYLRRHGSERHAVALESDSGGDRVWRLDVNLPPAALPVRERLLTALSPLGIAPGVLDERGGSDIGPIVNSGVPVIGLTQDMTRYFDLHHTPEDTLDKVDRAQLQQNVAAWTATVAILANAPEEFAAIAPR